MTDSTLSQIARKLSERAFASDCPHASGLANLKRCRECSESAIREAMLLALQKAEQAVLQTTDCPVANSDESQVRHYALRAGAHAIAELKSELIPFRQMRKDNDV